MIHRATIRSACLTAIVTMASGCATITTGTTQNLTLVTAPPGASCTVQRSGEVLGVITAAPSTLNISKGSRKIEVVCDLPEHATTTQTLESDFQAMTLGNVLIGGVVGVVVDAASGAAGKYPDRVSVAMVPNRFDTVAARDAYFDALRTKLEEHAVKVRDWIRTNCQGSDCAKRQQDADRAAAEVMARVAQQQQVAIVQPSSGS